MFVIVWRYEVPTSDERGFSEAYGPEGPWVRLFSLHRGYLGTELVATTDPGVYLSVDRWDSEASFDLFMDTYGEKYEELDRSMSALTIDEKLVGRGTVV